MYELIQRIWSEEQGQDIAEYAVMLAVILVLVVGTIRNFGRLERQQCLLQRCCSVREQKTTLPSVSLAKPVHLPGGEVESKPSFQPDSTV